MRYILRSFSIVIMSKGVSEGEGEKANATEKRAGGADLHRERRIRV